MTPAEAIKNAWLEHVRANQARERSTTAPPYVYASAWHPCDRKLALDLLAPEDRGEFEDGTLERFDRGLEIERMMVARLSLAGRYGQFTVEASQKRYEIMGRNLRAAVPHRDLLPVIVGKIDGLIRFYDATDRPIPFDIKSGAAVQHADSVEKLLEGRWTRGMVYQLLAYCYGENAELGLLIIDKPAGPTFIEIRLEDHLDKMEAFIMAAELAVATKLEREPTSLGPTSKIERLEARTEIGDIKDSLPPFIDELGECFTCDHYKKSCEPPIKTDGSFEVITDPSIIEMAGRVLELGDLGKEYNRKDKKIKARLRGIEAGSIGGEFDFTGKWCKRSETVYPEKCPECETPIEPEKVSNPKGQFRIKIVPAKEGGEGDGDG